MKITATIITKNEERSLGRTLASLRWCDEIIVLDSGSTDSTQSIAIHNGAKFHQTDFYGFGEQKAKATKLASHEWILNVDADEVISSELATKIKTIIRAQGSPKQYRLNIQNIFLGQPLQFFFSKGQKHIRLFHRQYANFNSAKVHEKVIGQGKVAELDEPVYHYSYRNLSHYIEKLNFYTDFSYKKTSSHWWMVYLAPLRFIYTFFNILFIKGSIRSGYRGILWALLSAFYTFIKHLKLVEESYEAHKDLDLAHADMLPKKIS